MPHHLTLTRDIVTTITRFQDCRTPAEVGSLLASVIVPFGLKCYAIGGMPTPSDPNPTSFMFHNWPDDWNRLYFEKEFASVDPVPRAAMTSAKPLTIGELRAGKAGFMPGPESDEYFATAERMTGGKGLIVPIFGPHGYHGIVVLVGEAEDFTPEQRVLLHMVAVYAHDRMLDLFGGLQNRDRPLLSAREVEVLRCARLGEGDEAIAQSLGISVRTVRFHFSNVRGKLRVKTRSEALVHAVGQHLLGS